MIISKSPLRISFLGGGTDYKEFYQNKPGAVFGASINSYVYINLLKLNDISRERIRFTYRQTESVNKFEEIKHPVVREALKIAGIDEKLNISTMSDVPGNTGLGSSSAFTVGFLNLLNAFEKKDMEPLDLARKAILLERSILGEPGGIQDQLFASFGGLSYFTFFKEKIEFQRVSIDTLITNEISKHLLLIPTLGLRKSHVHAERTQELLQAGTIYENQQESNLKYLSIAIPRLQTSSKLSHFLEVVNESLFRSWETKKLLYKSAELHKFKEIEQSLKSLGATSYKICGAGAEGYVLAYFPFPIQSELDDLTLGEGWIAPQIVNIGSQIVEI